MATNNTIEDVVRWVRRQIILADSVPDRQRADVLRGVLVCGCQASLADEPITDVETKQTPPMRWHGEVAAYDDQGVRGMSAAWHSDTLTACLTEASRLAAHYLLSCKHTDVRIKVEARANAS